MWQAGSHLASVRARVEGLERAGQILNLHVFHLLQTVSEHSSALDVGFRPAASTEAYRGHIFWDELFIFPFLDYRYPELTRALLLYRYRRLPGALGRPRGGLPRCDVSLAERQQRSRGEPVGPSQRNREGGSPTTLDCSDTSESQSPTTCGILPGHRRPRFPRRLRSGDADRDRPVGRAWPATTIRAAVTASWG